MPIRFRCAYCNQLMAISRRKAGTVVRCPKCAGDIIVPAPDGTQPLAEEQQVPANPALDDPNFDAYLHDPAPPPNPPAKAPTEKAPRPFEDSSDSPSMPPVGLNRRGIFLPFNMILILIGVSLLLLILVFGLGFFAGRSTAPVEQKKAAAVAVP